MSKSSEQLLSRVNVLAELDAIGWAYEPVSDEEVKVRCPAHDDAHASCMVNLVKHVFCCHAAGCPTQGRGGDFITFLSLALRQPRAVAVETLRRRYGIEDEKTVDPEAVERWHAALWNHGPMLRELRSRGVTNELIRTRRLGWDGRRISIPVYDEHGNVVNVRRYLPGAPGPEKMRNLRGRGRIRLYPLDQLAFPTVIVTGGELKAVVTAHHMNAHGIGCVTATAGEGNWETEFSKALRGKKLYVAMDVDDAGASAAEKICARLCSEASWVGKLTLDLNVEKHPHGDLNDYWGAEQKTPEDMLKLMSEVERWSLPATQAQVDELSPSDTPTTVHLSKVSAAEFVGRRVSVRAVVTAKDETPYVLPHKVECQCDRSQPFCLQCPVFAQSPDEDTGGVTLTLDPGSPGTLSMIGQPKKAQREATREALRIPPCKVVTFRPKSMQNYEELRLTPQLEIGDASHGYVMQPAFCAGHGLELNASYELVGRVFPHPKDQHAVLLATQASQTENSLDLFDPSDLELEELTAFQPSGWSVPEIEAKLHELYEDLSWNVTHIYERQDLHMMIDLAYHSVLLFNADRRQVKGWVEVLIVGDSSQGKTETTSRLMRHYRLGEQVVCKNASVAGLLGGLQMIGTRWFVTWGVIPTHDRRLVILEELKGASTEVISKLTDMRSSGIAEIPKIEKRRTHARTRLIAQSNPRSESSISTYGYGIEAIRDLVGSLEDVRRFDAALVVTRDQVDASKLNVMMQNPRTVQHRFTGDLCRRLVLWAWTRRPEQIVFTEEATASTTAGSVALCSKFTDAIPLVDRGSMRYKIMRLSAALACRTFSSARENLKAVVVRGCHADFVVKMLDRIYSTDEFGYAEYSKTKVTAQSLHDEAQLRMRIAALPYPRMFTEMMLNTAEVDARDVSDWCGWDFDDGRDLVSQLVRHRALVRHKNAYRKTAAFISFLRMLDVPDRPAWVKEPNREM